MDIESILYLHPERNCLKLRAEQQQWGEGKLRLLNTEGKGRNTKTVSGNITWTRNLSTAAIKWSIKLGKTQLRPKKSDSGLNQNTTYVVFLLKQKCKCSATTERDLPLSLEKKSIWMWIVYICEYINYNHSVWKKPLEMLLSFSSPVLTQFNLCHSK